MSTQSRRLAAAGLAGAAGLLVYLAAKPRFHGPVAWHLPLVPPGVTTTAYHLLEAVPVVLVLAGVLAFEQTRPDAAGVGRQAGYSLAVSGAHGTIYAHFGEHLLPAVPVPGTAVANVFVYLYFGSWLLAGVGLGVYGLAVLSEGGAPATGAAIAATLPLGVVAGAAVVALGVDNFGDGLKLPFALAAAAAAVHAWVASEDDAAAAGVGRRAD